MSNLKPNPCTPRSHNRPVIQHANEVSVGTAEPRYRTDILDQKNGGPTDVGVGPGDGAAPGASGVPTTGGGSTVPYGID